MDTQKAISIFEKLCEEESLKKYRQQAVQLQHQRNIWEFSYEDGVIRIQNDGLVPIIIIFFTEEYCKQNYIKSYSSSITMKQYMDLQKKYVGDFVRDMSVLK